MCVYEGQKSGVRSEATHAEVKNVGVCGYVCVVLLESRLMAGSQCMWFVMVYKCTRVCINIYICTCVYSGGMQVSRRGTRRAHVFSRVRTETRLPGRSVRTDAHVC